MEISYKIPKAYMFIPLAIGIFYPLGTFGFIDNSFDQSTESRWFSLIAYLSALFYCYITPRDRKIIANEEGISVPRILLPPYTTKFLPWNEIIHFRERTPRGGNIIVLKTKNDKIEIKSTLCFSDYEFARSPKAYDQLLDYIILRVPNQAKGKYRLF